MFDSHELAETIELQQKSYDLLRWVAKNLRKGTLDFGVTHEAASTFEAAKEWISRHWNNLPESVRPAESQLDRFAHVFSSYLRTSFTLVEKPPKKLVSYCGCYCSYCSYLGRADHLKARSLSKGAKRSAEELKQVYLHSLAEENQITLPGRQVQALLTDPELKECLALATYGRELVRRTEYASQGEGVLALWRQFAWNENGNPKPKFKLNKDDILEAERNILLRFSAV